jgi:signal transduction histidine kinase
MTTADLNSDIGAVARFALKLLNYRLQKKMIVVDENLPARPCMMWGIHAQMVQVFVNGITNAIDASELKGTISVALSDSKDYYLIEISDTGTGIEPSIAGKVFDPFFTTKGSHGTGLGLYVSYNIIREHKGTITLSSRAEGKGATLKITIPKTGTENLSIETLPQADNWGLPRDTTNTENGPLP